MDPRGRAKRGVGKTGWTGGRGVVRDLAAVLHGRKAMSYDPSSIQPVEDAGYRLGNEVNQPFR